MHWKMGLQTYCDKHDIYRNVFPGNKMSWKFKIHIAAHELRKHVSCDAELQFLSTVVDVKVRENPSNGSKRRQLLWTNK